MDVLARTRSYTTVEGLYTGTVWSCMPYRTLLTDMRIADLDAMDPQLVYIHKETGERSFEEPPDHAKAVERAVKLKSPLVKSAWTAQNRWNTIHSIFWQVEPAIIAIDFPEFTDQTPAEVRSFADYWQAEIGDVEERWKVFRAIIGTDTANAMARAYTQTRDAVLAAPPELQTSPDGADPEKKSEENSLNGEAVAS